MKTCVICRNFFTPKLRSKAKTCSPKCYKVLQSAISVGSPGTPKPGRPKGSKNVTYQIFIIQAQTKFGILYDYSKIEQKCFNSQQEYEIGYKNEWFLITPKNHLKAKCGSRLRYDELQKDTSEKFIEKAKKIHGDLYDYSKVIYNHSDLFVEIVCKEHGSFFIRGHSHISGCGCPKCSRLISAGEIKWLNSLGIPNDKEHRQVRIPVCKTFSYFVDGYDPITKTIYEYDGDLWHGNPEYYEANMLCKPKNTTYGELFKRTLSRNQAFKTLGYNLVTVWDSQFNPSSYKKTSSISVKTNF